MQFKPEEIVSPKAVAEDLGITRQRLSMLFKHKRWPEWLRSKPPWTRKDIENIRRWMAQNLRPYRITGTTGYGPGNPVHASAKKESKDDADTQLKKERAAYVRLQRKILARQYLKRSEVYRRWVERVHEVRRALTSLGRNIAPELLGLEHADQIEEVINSRVNEILTSFSRGESYGENESRGDRLLKRSNRGADSRKRFGSHDSSDSGDRSAAQNNDDQHSSRTAARTKSKRHCSQVSGFNRPVAADGG